MVVVIGFGFAVNGQQQNNTVIIQQNTTPVVIEKPVYIERYRTVYVDKPQPKRTARKLSAPVQLLGYLWIHTEDLGNFKSQPHSAIASINAQNPHGRNDWRIPTPDELAIMEANADKIGLGDDMYMATDASNGVLRLVSTGKTVAEKEKERQIAEAEQRRIATEAEQRRIAENARRQEEAEKTRLARIIHREHKKLGIFYYLCGS